MSLHWKRKRMLDPRLKLYILIIDHADAERSSTVECKLKATLQNTAQNLPISMELVGEKANISSEIWIEY